MFFVVGKALVKITLQAPVVLSCSLDQQRC